MNAKAVFVLALLAAPLSAQALRSELSLNGTWTFKPLRPSLPAGTIVVPSWWSDHNPDWDDHWGSGSPCNKTIFQARYSRQFTFPAEMAGKVIKLRFGEVNHSCEVKIDGQPVGPKHYQGAVPFEYDVTSFFDPLDPTQTHTLALTVWDHLDLTDDPTHPLLATEYLYPFGHPMWANRL